MILTCPKCATRFFADDHAIGPSGRRVKCAACGEVWLSAGMDYATDPSWRGTPPPDPTLGDEGGAPVDTPLFVERAPPTRKAVRRPSRTPWVMSLLIVALAIVGVFVFQRQIERRFPQTSAVYQSLGLRSFDRAGG